MKKLSLFIIVVSLTIALFGPTKKKNWYVAGFSDAMLAGSIINDKNAPFTSSSYYSVGQSVFALDGWNDKIVVSTGNQLKFYSVANPTPTLLTTKSFAKPIKDVVMTDTNLYIGQGNKIEVYNIQNLNNIYKTSDNTIYNSSDFVYTNSGPYLFFGGILFADGTLDDIKVMVPEDYKIYVGDGHGITVLDRSVPGQVSVVANKYTSGNVEAMDISATKIYLYDRGGLKIYNKSDLSLQYSESQKTPCNNPVIAQNNDDWYITCDSNVYRIVYTCYDTCSYQFKPISGNANDLKKSFTNGNYTYGQDGSTIKVSYTDISTPVCGNEVIESGEVCEANSTVPCSSIGYYISGMAKCKSGCQQYDTSQCVVYVHF